jgi:protein-disulfide isomerase
MTQLRDRKSSALGALVLALVLVACQPVLGGSVEPNPTETATLPPPTEVRDDATLSPVVVEGSYQEGFTAQGDPFRGSLDAPVLVEEFSSYQCPFCAKYFRESYPQLVAEYVETGQVLYIFRDFPLPGHPQSRLAAEAANCAGQLGGGSALWAMHDRLFEGQGEWSGKIAAGKVFKGYADEQGLDTADFGECLDSGATRAQIDADASEGSARGVRGTPTFFINGRPLVGAQPYEIIAQFVDAALAGETAAAAEPPPAPTPAHIAPADDVMTLGDDDAAVTIVEFSDYQCPFCASHYRETWPLLKAEFVDTGRVRYVFKDNPLTNIHPQAPKAHEAARCAGDQGAYWEMHDLLFDKQAEWGGSSDHVGVLKRYASELGLAADAFAACLDDDRWAGAVIADTAEGASLGVRGTPTFFIDGYSLVGAQPYETLVYAIGLAEEGKLAGAFRRSE